MAERSHDYLFLPNEPGWASVILNCVHILWKTLVICFFVAYHYYSAGYIRKAREWDHRKTMVHNHEIHAKGTKGLQKRKLAWDWMIRHARKTTMKRLKKKQPDVTDGHFPEHNLDKKVKFSEEKELRLYAQKHNLNIGYPHNKLRDMERYVFGEFERSEYTSSSEGEVPKELKKTFKKPVKPRRKSSVAVTLAHWNAWKSQIEERTEQK